MYTVNYFATLLIFAFGALAVIAATAAVTVLSGEMSIKEFARELAGIGGNFDLFDRG